MCCLAKIERQKEKKRIREPQRESYKRKRKRLCLFAREGNRKICENKKNKKKIIAKDSAR